MRSGANCTRLSPLICHVDRSGDISGHQETIRDLIRSLPVRSASGLPVYVAASRAAPFSTPLRFARNDRRSRIEILVVILALRRKLDVLVSSFRVLEDFAFVIANHDFFVVVIEDVAGINWHLPTAAGSVDNELRHGVTRGVPAQALDDLDPLGDRG